MEGAARVIWPLLNLSLPDALRQETSSLSRDPSPVLLHGRTLLDVTE